tara:strand:- start:956 stop:1246 length:291 start_codon:yes stop_codon:yes gene_type:complete
MARIETFPLTFPIEQFYFEYDGRVGYAKIGSFAFGKVRWPRPVVADTEEFLYHVRQVINNTLVLAYHVAIADTRFQRVKYKFDFPQQVKAFIEEDS